MATYHINEHERYPVYILSPQGRPTIDLTDKELADYHDTCADWEAWQDRLEEAFEAGHMSVNPMRLTVISSDGVSQYTQGDQTLFDEISRHPERTVDGSAYTRGAFDAALIAQGFPAECVTWVCAEHRRHCTRIDTEHTQHACIWCDS